MFIMLVFLCVLIILNGEKNFLTDFPKGWLLIKKNLYPQVNKLNYN